MIIERPEGNKLTGLYRGKVIQHLPHGRLKVYIPAVYAAEWETHPEMLPAAEQLTPLFAGTNDGNGVFSYPNIGSIVMCQFINGDQNYPLVIGATLGGPNAFGQYEWIKDRSEEISRKHLITADRSQLELYEDGIISAIVSTPHRREANVDFDSRYNSISSTSHVTSRPDYTAIVNDEIININCQHILDDTTTKGNIRQNTHNYEVSSFQIIEPNDTIVDTSYQRTCDTTTSSLNDSVSYIYTLSDKYSHDQKINYEINSPYREKIREENTKIKNLSACESTSLSTSAQKYNLGASSSTTKNYFQKMIDFEVNLGKIDSNYQFEQSREHIHDENNSILSAYNYTYEYNPCIQYGKNTKTLTYSHKFDQLSIEPDIEWVNNYPYLYDFLDIKNLYPVQFTHVSNDNYNSYQNIDNGKSSDVYISHLSTLSHEWIKYQILASPSIKWVTLPFELSTHNEDYSYTQQHKFSEYNSIYTGLCVVNLTTTYDNLYQLSTHENNINDEYTNNKIGHSFQNTLTHNIRTFDSTNAYGATVPWLTSQETNFTQTYDQNIDVEQYINSATQKWISNLTAINENINETIYENTENIYINSSISGKIENCANYHYDKTIINNQGTFLTVIDSQTGITFSNDNTHNIILSVYSFNNEGGLIPVENQLVKLNMSAKQNDTYYTTSMYDNIISCTYNSIVNASEKESTTQFANTKTEFLTQTKLDSGTHVLQINDKSGKVSYISFSNSGVISISASTTVNVTAPNIVINGDVTVNGNIVATGTITDSGCTLATHKHSENQLGDVVSPGVMTSVGIG